MHLLAYRMPCYPRALSWDFCAPIQIISAYFNAAPVMISIFSNSSLKFVRPIWLSYMICDNENRMTYVCAIAPIDSRAILDEHWTGMPIWDELRFLNVLNANFENLKLRPGSSSLDVFLFPNDSARLWRYRFARLKVNIKRILQLPLSRWLLQRCPANYFWLSSQFRTIFYLFCLNLIEFRVGRNWRYYRSGCEELSR